MGDGYRDDHCDHHVDHYDDHYDDHRDVNHCENHFSSHFVNLLYDVLVFQVCPLFVLPLCDTDDLRLWELVHDRANRDVAACCPYYRQAYFRFYFRFSLYLSYRPTRPFWRIFNSNSHSTNAISNRISCRKIFAGTRCFSLFKK